MGQHHKLISNIDKALSLLSHKVYTDILSEIDPGSDYSLYDILLRCRSELLKIDERDLLKIANSVQKEIDK